MHVSLFISTIGLYSADRESLWKLFLTILLLIIMSKEINHSFGGLRVRDNNQINNNLFCGLCKLLLLNPMQLLCCGTRLCRWCSKKGVPERWLFLHSIKLLQFLTFMFIYSEPFICSFCGTRQSKKQVT